MHDIAVFIYHWTYFHFIAFMFFIFCYTSISMHDKYTKFKIKWCGLVCTIVEYIDTVEKKTFIISPEVGNNITFEDDVKKWVKANISMKPPQPQRSQGQNLITRYITDRSSRWSVTTGWWSSKLNKGLKNKVLICHQCPWK